MTITYDEFAASCVRVTARGHRPSYRLVAADLGRGSHTTMREFFARWRSEQAAQQASEPSAEMKALEALSPGAAARLKETFRAEVAAEVAALRLETAAQARELQDLHDVIVDLERSRDALQVRLAAAENVSSALAAIEARSDEAADQLKTAIDQVASVDRCVTVVRNDIGTLQTETTKQLESLFKQVDALTREQLREHLKASNEVHRRHLEVMMNEQHTQLQVITARHDAAMQQQASAHAEAIAELTSLLRDVSTRQVALVRETKWSGAVLRKSVARAAGSHQSR
jgi:hypothetical protein